MQQMKVVSKGVVTTIPHVRRMNSVIVYGALACIIGMYAVVTMLWVM